MKRTARCSCGQLKLTVEGEPRLVVLCSCTECQRRTGSAFGIGAYFRHDAVTSIDGAEKTYRRSSDSGRSAEAHFCPECGTTVYWQLELFPDQYGVAVGCFTDPDFPQPKVAVWSATKHDWVTLPDQCRAIDDQGG